MNDFQAIADRVEMPNIPAELAGQDAIRAFGKRVPELQDFFVQNTHPGMIQLDGDAASGRAYMHELGAPATAGRG
jgi:hypothetical protein